MKNRLTPKLGSIVLSRAGRDEGRRFLVVGLEGEEYALIADGDLRMALRPKRKKYRHLYVVQLESSLQKDLEEGRAVSDSEIRACLQAAERSEEG